MVILLAALFIAVALPTPTPSLAAPPGSPIYHHDAVSYRYDVAANLPRGVTGRRDRSSDLDRPVAVASGDPVAHSDELSAPRAPGLGDDFWRATNVGPNRAGTLVPESFDLAVGGQKFYVHPNATKHMAEYASSHQLSNVPARSRDRLRARSLRG